MKSWPSPTTSLGLAGRSASVLRASGNYEKLEEALSLIEKNLATSSSPDDQWEKALPPWPPRRSREPPGKRAIRILEQLLPTQPDVPELRLTLAQLYLAEKDWPKASEQFRKILANHDKEPRYITLFISRLLERKESDEADVWLNKLDLLAPADFSTISLKAEALVVRDQIDLALETLRAYLSRATAKAATPVERAAVVRQIAAFLEALATLPTGLDQKVSQAKLIAEADSLYRRYAQEQPDQKMVLASFFARRERFDDALSVVTEEAWQAAGLGGIVRVTGDMLASGISDPKQCQQLEKILLEAADRYHQPTVLLLELADLRNREEHLDDAEANYRAVLKQEPNSFVAMNNLRLTHRQIDRRS